MGLQAILGLGAPAVLVLADGTVFEGSAFGAKGAVTGEVVFNTAITGYQEILSDPSYDQQIITFTYPHIGNVGINKEDLESSRIWAKGMVIRDLALIRSNWRAEVRLETWLEEHNVVGIAGIDTRRLARIIRDQGAMGGCIITDPDAVDKASAYAKEFPGLAGQDLTARVTTPTPYQFEERVLFSAKKTQMNGRRLVVIDYGVKRQILRYLVETGCEVWVLPAHSTLEQIMQYKPDGIVLSNGPGDPAACESAIQVIRELIAEKIPLLGICLGFQLLALALGGKTFKMKFGHHGANHPVQDLETGHVSITSQNHGFSVDGKSLPKEMVLTHRSLFDQTLQGFRHCQQPIFGFQGHPEASPGPQELSRLFDDFVKAIQLNAERIIHA